MKKNWKRLLAMGIGFTLTFGQITYGTMISSRAAATTQSAASTQSVLKEPTVSAQGAVLMDAATGQVLFGKNQDQQFFPASITKVMTALLVLERCNLSDVVTFSKTATTNLESGATSLGIAEGDQLTVEQCLYGLLLKSANEIGNGLAEHVAGSVSAFADLMNQRAAQLGCKNTHFANPHGLNNSTHKTTAYDMALIMRAAVQNDTFRKIDTTTSYNFPATKNSGARTITMGHKMMYPTDTRYYAGIIGGKTGYTSLAGNTLVTAVERNGVRLIAVVLKSAGTHYTDTKAMLDYGFANYTTLTGRTGSQNAGSTQPGTTGTAASGTVTSGGPGVSGGTSGTTSSAPSAGTSGNTTSGTVNSGSGSAPAAGSSQGPSGNGTPAASAPSAGTSSGGVSTEGPGGAIHSMGSASGAPGGTSGTLSQPGTTGTQSPSSGASATATAPGSLSGASSGWKQGWNQDQSGWYYIKTATGVRAAGEWLSLNGQRYWFDSNGYMATGWRTLSDGWYYFMQDTGYMLKNNWMQTNGLWYYLGSNGAMLTNATTPDGYHVDQSGVWVK
ncbi:serine hydrolase [Brotaphodocola sp.]|uniref:D-alanyl-D-alanine carboxypeptidase family protein n=1 Tax=Brotaphodocola sp. TaxID=3073577 RepID=UPI003D7CF8E7